MTNIETKVKPRTTEGLFLWVVFGICLLSFVVIIIYLIANLIWSEIKGPYRGITDVADLDGDGDLDVVLGQTRWETEDISWAGISLWFNQGEGQFTPDDQDLPDGFSAAASDLDRDGDADLLVLEMFTITYMLNQGGAQRFAQDWKGVGSPRNICGAGSAKRDSPGPSPRNYTRDATSLRMQVGYLGEEVLHDRQE